MRRFDKDNVTSFVQASSLAKLGGDDEAASVSHRGSVCPTHRSNVPLAGGAPVSAANRDAAAVALLMAAVSPGEDLSHTRISSVIAALAHEALFWHGRGNGGLG